MGNCSQCLREGQQQPRTKNSLHSTHISSSLDDTSISRYTKITLDQVYQDGIEELSNIQKNIVDDDQLLNFTVHLYNMRLLSFLMKDEIFVQGDIDEDTQRRRKDNYLRNKNLESVQQNTISTLTTHPQPIEELLMKGVSQTNNDITQLQGIKWRTAKYRVDSDGNQEIELDNHFRYECSYKEIWNKCFFIEFYLAKQPLKPFAYVVIDFLALAIGPKSCDLEIRDFKTKKFVGRVAFDISIKQLQQIELQLFDLKCKLNHKEDKALYGQFKLITSSDGPKVSKPTYSQIGRYKKEKQYTRFRWMMNEDQDDIPTVRQIVSLESLKNATLQLVLKVDRNFSEAMHQQVVQKMSLVERYKLNKNEKQSSDRSKVPQINVEPAVEEAKSNSLGQENQFSYKDINLLISRDSSNSKILTKSLLTGEQKEQINTTRSFLDAKQFKQHQSQMIEDHLQNRKFTTDQDMYKYLGSPQFCNELNESEDPVGLLQKIYIVKRSKSILQKRERKSVIIDAADYYSKYNEVGDNSLSLITSFIGECYLGVTKLLQSEYRQFDRRDSSILQSKLNSSIKLSYQDSLSIRDGKLDQGVMEEESKQQTSIKPLQQKNNNKKYFQEQLWIMGKVIGTLSGTIKVNNLPLIQQMALGILTEGGIVMNQAPILIEEREGVVLGLLKRKQRNERITSLIDLTKKLKKIDTLKGKKQIYQTYNDKERILNELILILCESDKTVQGHMYKYVDDFDLIRAQQALIELAFHCLLLVESVRYEFKRDYYELISQILMRDELKLPNVTLKGTNITQVKQQETKRLNRLLDDHNNDKSVQLPGARDNSLKMRNGRVTPSVRIPLAQDSKFGQKQYSGVVDISMKSNITVDRYDEDTKERLRQEKFKIAVFYQKLLYQVLDDCLNKFTRKDVEPYLKSYMEICISLSFFRVPRFQRLFIDCISEHTEMKIQEWKGVTWNIDDEMSLDIEAGMASLYDWDSNFHKMIPQSEETVESQQLIRRIEANKRWQTRIKKRSIAFFQIVKRWANLLNNQVQSLCLFWQDIPGYCFILKQMLVQLKERNVADYADSLIDAISALLPNTQLLTVCINIIFGKTNAFDSKTLCISMDIATKWINYVEQNGFEFPSNFDFQFFFKGISVALDMDHSLSTPRTLYLIYRVLHFLPLDQRSKIVTMLLQKYFHQLIFSWSYTIRELFISLMLYQIEYFYINAMSANLQIQRQANNYYSSLIGQPTFIQQDKDKDAKDATTSKLALTIENFKQQRKDHFKQLDQQMKQFETYLSENPYDGQLIFEQQFMNKRQRLISDVESLSLVNQRKQTKIDQQQQQQQQQHAKLEKKVSIDSHTNEGDGGSQHKDSTLKSYLKAHAIFRQRMNELETIEEYYQMKKNALQRMNSNKQSSSQTAGGTPNSFLEQQSTEIKSHDIEANYQRILQSVPSHLKVYIPSAIDELNKQLEEYESWKSGTVSYHSDVLSVLPEFNMEKNMPVEDDENLDKQEEW